MTRRIALLGEPYAAETRAGIVVWFNLADLSTRRIEVFPARLIVGVVRFLGRFAKAHPFAAWSFDVDVQAVVKPPGSYAVTSIEPAEKLDALTIGRLSMLRPFDLALWSGALDAPTTKPRRLRATAGGAS